MIYLERISGYISLVLNISGTALHLMAILMPLSDLHQTLNLVYSGISMVVFILLYLGLYRKKEILLYPVYIILILKFLNW